MEVHGSSPTSPPLTLPASARHEMLVERAHPRSGSRRIFSRNSREMRANPGQQVFSQSTTSCGEDSRRAVNTDDLLQEGLLSRQRTGGLPRHPTPCPDQGGYRGGIGGPRTTYYALGTLRSCAVVRSTPFWQRTTLLSFPFSPPDFDSSPTMPRSHLLLLRTSRRCAPSRRLTQSSPGLPIIWLALFQRFELTEDEELTDICQALRSMGRVRICEDPVVDAYCTTDGQSLPPGPM